MKKLFITLSIFCGLATTSQLSAQSFTCPHDTVTISTESSATEHNDITVPGSTDVTVQWRVSATDFPSDWINAAGVCDNSTCISGTGIWNTSTSTGPTYEATYSAGATQEFKLQMIFSGTEANGTHFMNIHLKNKTGMADDTLLQTYMVTKVPGTSVATVKVVSDVVLYPNPSTTNLNVVFNAGADVKNIAVYSIIGKQMNLYRVGENANSASLNVANLPAGVYFVRLMNAHGDVVTTRKFTKQ